MMISQIQDCTYKHTPQNIENAQIYPNSSDFRSVDSQIVPFGAQTIKTANIVVSEINSCQIVQQHPKFHNKTEEWTQEDQDRLIALHNEKGNKWVEIAKKLNRSDNFVKNHYHSRLRKALRKINTAIVQYMKGEFKSFKPNLLSRIVQTAQGCYQKISGDSLAEAQKAFSLKNSILKFGESPQIQFQQLVESNQLKNLVIQVAEFNNTFKNKSQCPRYPKNSQNKYKGKEIISLISQNQIKKDGPLKTILSEQDMVQLRQINQQEENPQSQIEEKLNQNAQNPAQSPSIKPSYDQKQTWPRTQQNTNGVPMIGYGWNNMSYYYVNPYMAFHYYSMVQQHQHVQLHSGKASSFSVCAQPSSNTYSSINNKNISS